MRLVIAFFLLVPAYSNAILILGDFEWEARAGGTYYESADQASDDELSDGWVWANRDDVTGLGLNSAGLTAVQDEQLLGDFAGDCALGGDSRRHCWLWLGRDTPLPPLHPLDTLGWQLVEAAYLNPSDSYLEDDSFLFDTVYSTNSYARLAYRPVAAVPLPATAWLFITALVGLGFFRKRAKPT